MEDEPMPFFSIVIPTRNRPSELERALQSLHRQTSKDFEVIVADDGSTAENQAQAAATVGQYGSNFRFCPLPPGKIGRGPASARNYGASQAHGSVIGFLDDDDYWIDDSHLLVAQEVFSSNSHLDVFIANQEARRGGSTIVRRWQPPLFDAIERRKQIHNSQVFELVKEDVLTVGGIGFAHVNVTLVRRSLFSSIAGFNEALRFEEDLDFFLRAVDASVAVAFRPKTVSVNVLREADDTSGASSYSSDSKITQRISACESVLAACSEPAVRRYAECLSSGALRNLAKFKLAERNFKEASDLAERSNQFQPSLKWALFSKLVWLRSLAGL